MSSAVPYYADDNEKSSLLDDDIENQHYEPFNSETNSIKSNSSSLKRKLMFTVHSLIFVSLVTYFLSGKNCMKENEFINNHIPSNPFEKLISVGGESSSVSAADPIAPIAPVEVFEVLRPLSIPLDSYTVNETLFNETKFKKSSIKFDYTAPEVFNFTDILFTLNFSTAGDQEPVIADLYIDDFPIWRTSTPNPFGLSANSSTIKNLTDYLSLFTENRTISLSLVDGTVTGKLNVSLEASFYNDTLTAVAAPIDPAVDPIDVAALFAPTGPADIIVPLSNKGSSFQFPKDKILLTVPQLPVNVTSAHISLFASTSEDEVRYFRNDIGATPGVADIGPVRSINVFANGIFVGAISPNPSLLRADKVGIETDAAAMWSPLASVGAFDAGAYDLDLTAILPLLWEDDVTLEIEVVSLVKTSTIAGPPVLPKPVPAPGTDPLSINRWDITGNLLAWQSHFINSSVGEILTADSLMSGTGMIVGPPTGVFHSQIVRSKISSGLISALNFTLADNTTLNVLANSNSSSKIFTSSQKSGASNKLTLIGSSSFGLAILNNTLPPVDDEEEEALGKKKVLSPLAIFSYNESTASPMVLKETLATTPVWGPATNASLEVTVGYGSKVKINGLTAYYFDSKQKATLDPILGNSTDSKVSETSIDYPVPFKREVTAENGIITADTDAPAFFETEEFDFSFEKEETFNQAIDLIANLYEL